MEEAGKIKSGYRGGKGDYQERLLRTFEERISD